MILQKISARQQEKYVAGVPKGIQVSGTVYTFSSVTNIYIF